MIYYPPQFLRRNKRRRRKKCRILAKQFIVEVFQFGYERAFHLRLITLCSTCVFFFSLSLSFAQLPLFIRHFFSIRTFSVLFIYSLRSFEQQKTASMHNRTELDVICCCFVTAFIRIQTCRRIHEFWCVFYFLSLSLRVAHNKESVLGWCWAWHCSCAIKCYANN